MLLLEIDKADIKKKKSLLLIIRVLSIDAGGEKFLTILTILYITVVKEQRVIPPKYDSIVIGSGFGGPVSALTLAKRYKQEPNNQRVCILERGQWWVSHEMPARKDGTIDGGTTIREFLHQNDMPYSTWAYPDDMKGLLNVSEIRE